MVNSVGSRPREIPVKSCKLLFREPYHYSPAKPADEDQSRPAPPDRPLLRGLSDSFATLSSPSHRGGLWTPRIHRSSRNLAASCVSREQEPVLGCARSQSMTTFPPVSFYLRTNLTHLLIELASLSNQRQQPPIAKDRPEVRQREGSFHPPRIVRATPLLLSGPLLATTEASPPTRPGHDSGQPEKDKAKTMATQPNKMKETKEEDIARIYKVDQFPHAISRSILLDNYKSASTRERNVRSQSRKRRAARRKASNDSLLRACCPHCEDSAATLDSFCGGNSSVGSSGNYRLADDCSAKEAAATVGIEGKVGDE